MSVTLRCTKRKKAFQKRIEGEKVMRSYLRIVTVILFMMIGSAAGIHAQVAETSAAVENSTLETASTSAEGGGQIHNLPSYSLKKGDNEFGFWGGIGFK